VTVWLFMFVIERDITFSGSPVSIQTTLQKSETLVQNKTAAISKLLSVADLQWTK